MWKIRKIKQQQEQKQTITIKTPPSPPPTKKKSQRQKQQQQQQQQQKEIQWIFPNDFSHVVCLFPHQKLLSTIHLRYSNYVIC